MEVDHGADAENGDEVHVPLQDGQLEEEDEEDDDDADDADVPAAAAGAEDASPGGVLPKLVASDYGTNSPTSKGARRTSITGKGTWFQHQAHQGQERARGARGKQRGWASKSKWRVS